MLSNEPCIALSLSVAATWYLPISNSYITFLSIAKDNYYGGVGVYVVNEEARKEFHAVLVYDAQFFWSYTDFHQYPLHLLPMMVLVFMRHEPFFLS